MRTTELHEPLSLPLDCLACLAYLGLELLRTLVPSVDRGPGEVQAACPFGASWEVRLVLGLRVKGLGSRVDRPVEREGQQPELLVWGFVP